MADWAYGLLNALILRPKIWYLDYAFKDAPEETQEVLLSFAIIHGVVYPEDARYLFKTKNGELSDENLNTALLFTFGCRNT
ncbi:MAG: hypothetical protein NZ845_06035 [Thermodesulfovibrio sp.]|nr:hypothetical protein [Thermodesulfovibrio sp.]MDW7972737.1 hypothetical protein [Thermodesulfovibrio sp.]